MTDSMERKLTELAWRDPKFRKLLEKDLKAVFKEIGMELPENIKLDVRQQRRDTYYYVIPPPADTIDESKPINQMDVWQSADLFVWIMPEKVKEQLLNMRQTFKRQTDERER